LIGCRNGGKENAKVGREEDVEVVVLELEQLVGEEEMAVGAGDVALVGFVDNNGRAL